MAPPLDVELQLQRHGTALRRLAAELLREPAAIDDALQETWLRAMRWPPRDTSGVGSWLARVLRNVVRRSRRRDALRERREAAVVRDEHVEDHALVAAREETAQRLFATLATLDDPTRDVVWRRFFEGQAPREIALARGEPVATVKSRLQRGIRELREQLGKDGRGEWRAAFASAFGFGKPGAVAAALAGGVVMATWTKSAAAAVVIAVVGVGWWWSRSDVDTTTIAVAPEAAAPVPVATSLSAAAHAPVEREAAVVSTPDPASARPGPAEAAARMSEPALVRGRAVDAKTGKPLEGVTVTMSAGKVQADRPDPTVTTSSDGVFELQVRDRATASLRLRRPDRSTQQRNPKAFAGTTTDVGDVPMPRGRIVRGRVVDEAGGPIPAKTFVAVRDASVGGHTDDAGNFATREPVAFGPTTWELPFGPFELTAPVRIDIGPEEPSELVLNVRARPCIRGVVVDENGKPVAGVNLADQPGLGTITSGDDGTFTMLRMRAGSTAVTIHVCDAPGCEPREPVANVPWGSDGVRIELRRLGPFTLEVVDEDGAPIEAFAVALERAGRMSMNGNVAQRGTHAGGRVVLDDVARGKTTLRVLPADRSFEPTDVIAVADVESLRVVLQRRVPARVSVHENGVAMPAVRVQLLRERGAARQLDSHVALAVVRGRSPRAELWPVPDPTADKRAWMRGDGTELVDDGTTGDDGVVVLRRARDASGCVLRVKAESRPFQIVRDVAWPENGEPLRIELVRHGSIAGRVVLQGRDPKALRVEVPEAQRIGGASVDLSAAGEFEVPDLEPGSYTLLLQRRSNGLMTLATQRVDVATGEPARVQFDVGATVSVTFEGVVAADGPLPTGLALHLYRLANGALECAGQSRLLANGAFTIADLAPGSYRAGLSTVDPLLAAPPALLANDVDVVAGAVASASIRFTPRRLVVRVVRPDGSAVRGARVLVRCDGTTWPSQRVFTPLVDEKLVLDPAPELPIELRDWAEGSSWSAPVLMPADRAEAEVTVVLPDPPK